MAFITDCAAPLSKLKLNTVVGATTMGLEL